MRRWPFPPPKELVPTTRDVVIAKQYAHIPPKVRF